MKLLSNYFAACLLCCLFASTTVAQERTAASVYNEGLALLKSKDYVEGLKLMEEALALAEASENEKVVSLAKKNGSVAASNIGNAELKAGNYDAAMEHYMKGLMLNPDNASNAMGKARVLGKQGKQQEAVIAYMEAGMLYNKTEKPDRAERSYKQAQTIIGKLYVAKDFDGALAAGEVYLGTNDNPEVRYYISRSLLEKGDAQGALDHINKSIEMATASGSVNDKYYWAQGMSFEKLGQNAQAVQSYQKISGEKYKAQAEYKITKLKT